MTRFAPTRVFLAMTAALAIALICVAAVAPNADAAFGMKSKWGYAGGAGGLGLADGEFVSPQSVAVGPGGDTYVVEAEDCSIRVFNSSLVPVRSWGGVCDLLSTSQTGLRMPRGIAVAMNGDVYVADTIQNRIQVYSSTGIWLRRIGYGADSALGGATYGPEDIALEPFSNTPDVFVSEMNGSRIQRLTSTGQLVWAAGKDVVAGNAETGPEVCTVAANCKSADTGSEDGSLSQPAGIDLASLAGPLVVADRGNNRIQKFNPATGASLGSNISTSLPYSVALDPNDGDVWSTNTGYLSPNLYRWDSAGNLLNTLGNGTPSSADGGLGQMGHIAITASGGLWVPDTAMHRVQQFSAAGGFMSRFGKNGGPGWQQGAGDGAFATPQDVFADSGSIWVADGGNNRIQKFDSAGTFQAKYGSSGATGGKFNQPNGITATGNEVWVADSWQHRIQKLTDNGDGTFTFNAALGKDVSISDVSGGAEQCTSAADCKAGVAGSGASQFNFPVDVAISPFDGYLYVVEQNNNRIQVFNRSTLALVDTVGTGTSGSANGQFALPQSITFAPDGTFWVTEFNNYRVQKFNADRTYNSKFTVLSADGYGRNPYGAALVGGNLHVSMAAISTVNVYDISGTPTRISSYGGIGSSDGEFYQQSEIAAGPSTGDVLVADSGNSRIQLLGDITPGSPTISISAPANNALFYNTTDVELDYSATNSASQPMNCSPLKHSRVALAEGPNTITVSCHNPFGADFTSSVSVTRTTDVDGPTAFITSPVADSEVSTPTTQLEYTASDNVDSSPNCTPASGSTVNLTTGLNVISVSCTDAAGNAGGGTVNVTYTPPPQQPTPPTSIVDPAVTVTLAAGKSGKFKGKVSVTAGCSMACDLQLAAAVKIGKKTLRASVSGTLAGAGSLPLTVKFSSKQTKAIKKALKAGKKLKARLTLTGRNSFGARDEKSTSVKLRK